MLMFSPPPYETIEHADSFRCHLGGAEVNVAIGLARLGLTAGWIGKLPRNALAERIVNQTRAQGVDTSAVVWCDEGRVGTFFFEAAPEPRPQITIYDRAESAAASLTSDELDWDYIAGAEWLHLTGITPAISPTCRTTVSRLAEFAKRNGLKISFDVNYRELMWTRDESKSTLSDLLEFVDLLIGTEDDLTMFTHGQPSREAALRQLVEDHSLEAAVMTLDSEGSEAFDGRHVHNTPGHTTQVVNRLGAGDAFVAGLLYGYLTADLETGLRYASAMAALKMTIPQNTPLVDKEAVDQLVAGNNRSLVR